MNKFFLSAMFGMLMMAGVNATTLNMGDDNTIDKKAFKKADKKSDKKSGSHNN